MSKKATTQSREFKFTRAKLMALPFPKTGQVAYRDLLVPGLKVRVGTKSKVFFFEARVRNAGSAKQHKPPIKVTIGKIEAWDVESARKEARRYSCWCDQGKDPRAVLKAKANVQIIDENPTVDLSEEKPITLQEACEVALNSPLIGETTCVSYRGVLRRRFQDWMNRPVSEITARDLKARHAHCLTISKCEAKRAFATLSSVWDKAYVRFAIEEERDFPVCPIKALRLNENQKWDKNRPVVTKTSLGVLVNAIQDQYRTTMNPGEKSHAMCFLLGLFTGYRGGEARKIKWEYISFIDGTITFPSEEVKNGCRHVKPLGPFILGLLKERYAQRDFSNPYVFPGLYSRKKSYIGKYFKAGQNVTRKCGVAFSPHALRRSFASLAEQIGVPRSVLKAFMNHKGDVTDGYIRDEFDPDVNRAWMIKIENILLEMAEAKKDAA